tara:strand:- start:49 stop:1227 length:1179 start_codon:yes stop_codon:yes gene_type:complete
MRILVLSSFYHPEKGAASHRITSMCNELLERGHEITVLTTLANYPKGIFFQGYRNRLFKSENINKIKIIRFWFFPTNSNSLILRFFSLSSSFIMALITLFNFMIKNKKIDFALIQTPPLTTAFAYSIICKLFRLKYVLNVSDIWPSTAVDLGIMNKTQMSFKIFTKIELFIYKHSAAFLCQSNECLNYLKNKSKKKILLFRNLTKNNIASSSSKIDGKVKIIYAGLLGNAQNILGLCKDINWDNLNIQFHIYGDGLQKKDLQKLENKNIYIHEAISKDDIQNKLKLFDFSLVPIRVNIFGAFPSKISAGIASGVPILFIGEGEGYKVVKDLNIGESFKNNELDKLQDFLKNYIENNKLYVSKYKKGIKLALDRKFNYKKNLDSLENFLTTIK